MILVHRVVNAVITITNPSIFPFIANTMAMGITSGAAARTFTGAIARSSSIAVIYNLLHTFIHTYMHTYIWFLYRRNLYAYHYL